MKNLIKQIIKESIGKETQIENIKNIPIPSTIKGRFLNKQQAQELQKEIEAKYVNNSTELFNKEKDDIRMHMFSYDQPIAEKNLNGINLRITTGLIRNKKTTYLLYADGKIIGEFYSVDDIKKLVKFIEDRLIKNISPNIVNEKVTKTKVICDNCGWKWNIKDGGKDPYLCHKCGHDNTPKNILNEKCWKGYTQKGMKTMFGKRYPNCVKKLKEQNSITINETIEEYSKWKRKNVTLRGIKELGKPNEVYGSFGKGLYTVPLSNKSMARQYGDIYFIVNAIPKNPKVVQNLNDAEILRYKLIDKYCKENNVNYSLSFFENNTSMENEMIKLGYDGLIIKGREMVNYKPNDIKYFRTENELQRYYERIS
jgi:hypothetical protein